MFVLLFVFAAISNQWQASADGCRSVIDSTATLANLDATDTNLMTFINNWFYRILANGT